MPPRYGSAVRLSMCYIEVLLNKQVRSSFVELSKLRQVLHEGVIHQALLFVNCSECRDEVQQHDGSYSNDWSHCARCQAPCLHCSKQCSALLCMQGNKRTLSLALEGADVDDSGIVKYAHPLLQLV